MKRKSYISSVMLTSAMAIVFSVSCERETSDVKTISEGVISYEVSTGSPQSSPVTKSGTSPMMLVSEEGDTLYLSVSASPNTDMVVRGVDVDTKGTPITTANLRTEYKKFNVMAFKTGTVSEPYINNETATYDSGSGSWPTETKYPWPFGYALDFYAYAPVAVTGLTGPTYGADNKMSFTYQLPAGGQTDSNGKFIDAKNQKDLLFAVTKNVTASTNSSKVGFTFEHALSAIRFVSGSIGGAGTLNDITLRNLSSKGDATFDGEAFTWSNQDSQTNSYSQSFDVELEKQTVAQDVTETDVTTTFMMIPQTIDGSTTLVEINYLKPGETEPVKFTASLPAIEWQAGYTYTYKFRLEVWVDIEIEDEVTGSVKSDLEISNVGGKDAYVRALIVGYWVNSDGDIVAAWDPSDETMGTFSPAIYSGSLNENWVKGADGFFYYTKILPAGDDTDTKLFTTYTANPASKPTNLKATDHLEIDIVSQAVAVDADKASITKAWGATAAGYVE